VKFLIDEDVAIEITRCLLNAGHEVLEVGQTLGFQTDDVDIWHFAIRSEAIVVTCNRQDFLTLAGTAAETGLIILNRRRTRESECRHILELLLKAGEAGLRNNINFA
jgi:predicted nuclease of predicted toxin-antitoxin system